MAAAARSAVAALAKVTYEYTSCNQDLSSLQNVRQLPRMLIYIDNRTQASIVVGWVHCGEITLVVSLHIYLG